MYWYWLVLVLVATNSHRYYPLSYFSHVRSLMRFFAPGSAACVLLMFLHLLLSFALGLCDGGASLAEWLCRWLLLRLMADCALGRQRRCRQLRR